MLDNINILYIMLLAIFILAILSLKKVVGILKNAMWIAVASVLFPIIMNKLFDFPIGTDADTLLTFMFLGLLTYGLFILGKSIYTALGSLEKSSKKITEPMRNAMLKKSVDKQKKLETKIQKERENQLKNEYNVIKTRSKKKKRDEDEDYVELKE